jgi:hypothetical protein
MRFKLTSDWSPIPAITIPAGTIIETNPDGTVVGSMAFPIPLQGSIALDADAHTMAKADAVRRGIDPAMVHFDYDIPVTKTIIVEEA